MPHNRFGANLRKARRRKGVTQEELGFLAGLHRTEISLLERGGREPRLTTLVKLAGALETSLDELCGGIRWLSRAGRFKVSPRSA